MAFLFLSFVFKYLPFIVRLIIRPRMDLTYAIFVVYRLFIRKHFVVVDDGVVVVISNIPLQ